jgi:amino acid transporter
MNKKKHLLGVGALALICIAATGSLRNLPSMAVYGWESIFWYLVGTLLFLIPISLVAAELATSLPTRGGVFTWIRSAFGERTGFFGVWSEWGSNIVWFPTILSFTAGTLAYAFNPELASNNVYLVTVMLAVFWVLILLNFLGTRSSSFISSFGSIVGTIFPQILLLVLAAVFIFRGSPLEIPFSREALSPDFSITSLPLLATMITMFAGMELAGYHASEVRNPARDYPRAILLACAAIFAASVLGTLAIAIVVPLGDLNLAAGLMQAFSDFLAAFNLESWVPVIAILVALGAVATISTWILGPAKGLHAAAERGNLPPTIQKTNKRGAPTAILLITAISGSLFILMFLFIPSVNTSYWILSALTTQMLTLMYFLCFISVVKLRRAQPHLTRPYKIPGGTIGLWLVCGAGVLACLFALVIGFIPPSAIPTEAWPKYVLFMLGGFVALSCPPFIFMAFKKASWKSSKQTASDEG